MTTFPDDAARLHLDHGAELIPLVVLGLSWPPPEHLTEIHGRQIAPMTRTSMSAITDEQRERMTHVFRGAEYHLDSTLKGA